MLIRGGLLLADLIEPQRSEARNLFTATWDHITKVSQVRKANPNITIFGGLGGMMFLEELRHGAQGTMTGFAFPEILAEIYQKYMSGDIDGATEVFYHYCPLIRFENQLRIGLALRKQVYYIRGAIDSPHVRSPYAPVDNDTLADLDGLLTRLNLKRDN